MLICMERGERVESYRAAENGVNDAKMKDTSEEKRGKKERQPNIVEHISRIKEKRTSSAFAFGAWSGYLCVSMFTSQQSVQWAQVNNKQARQYNLCVHANKQRKKIVSTTTADTLDTFYQARQFLSVYFLYSKWYKYVGLGRNVARISVLIRWFTSSHKTIRLSYGAQRARAQPSHSQRLTPPPTKCRGIGVVDEDVEVYS